MKRIALVLGCNFHWAPYFFKYKKVLEDNGIPYDLIFWNREGIQETVSANTVFSYNEPDQTSSGNSAKLAKFYRFSRFVKNILKTQQYDRVFFLGTYACVPALISGFLQKNYKNRYWVDIRDYQYEYNAVYRYLERRAILCAKYVAISSKKFETFLPKRDYLYIHNIDPQMEDFCKQYKRSDSDKIRISYIGHVTFLDAAKNFIDRIANDERYRVQYYGQGSEILQTYCKDRNIHNVDFFGYFDRERTIDFYNNTDIINNIYGNGDIHVRTALSNKLYYSIFLELPILVCKDTEMENIGTEFGFSFTYVDEPEFGNKLFDWYKKFISASRHDQFSLAKQRILNEDDQTMKTFLSFVGAGET